MWYPPYSFQAARTKVTGKRSVVRGQKPLLTRLPGIFCGVCKLEKAGLAAKVKHGQLLATPLEELCVCVCSPSNNTEQSYFSSVAAGRCAHILQITSLVPLNLNIYSVPSMLPHTSPTRPRMSRSKRNKRNATLRIGL